MLERFLNLTGTTYVLTRAAIFLAIIIGFFNAFIFGFTRVDGFSMSPTLASNDWVFVDKYSYRASQLKRGDVVDVHFPGDPVHTRYIKRVVGLPGEHISLKDGQVFVDGVLAETLVPAMPRPTKEPKLADKKWTLSYKEYFLMGDNQAISNDSRVFGPVEQRFVIGLARYIVWPPEDYDIINYK